MRAMHAIKDKPTVVSGQIVIRPIIVAAVMERVLAGEHDLTHAHVGWGTGTGSTYLPVSIFW